MCRPAALASAPSLLSMTAPAESILWTAPVSTAPVPVPIAPASITPATASTELAPKEERRGGVLFDLHRDDSSSGGEEEPPDSTGSEQWDIEKLFEFDIDQLVRVARAAAWGYPLPIGAGARATRTEEINGTWSRGRSSQNLNWKEQLSGLSADLRDAVFEVKGEVTGKKQGSEGSTQNFTWKEQLSSLSPELSDAIVELQDEAQHLRDELSLKTTQIERLRRVVCELLCWGTLQWGTAASRVWDRMLQRAPQTRTQLRASARELVRRTWTERMSHEASANSSPCGDRHPRNERTPMELLSDRERHGSPYFFHTGLDGSSLPNGKGGQKGKACRGRPSRGPVPTIPMHAVGRISAASLPTTPIRPRSNSGLVPAVSSIASSRTNDSRGLTTESSRRSKSRSSWKRVAAKSVEPPRRPQGRRALNGKGMVGRDGGNGDGKAISPVPPQSSPSSCPLSRPLSVVSQPSAELQNQSNTNNSDGAVWTPEMSSRGLLQSNGGSPAVRSSGSSGSGTAIARQDSGRGRRKYEFTIPVRVPTGRPGSPAAIRSMGPRGELCGTTARDRSGKVRRNSGASGRTG